MPCVPANVVASVTFDTSTMTRWRKVIASRSALLRAQGSLLVGAAGGVVEDGAGDALSRKLAQIVDAENHER